MNSAFLINLKVVYDRVATLLRRWSIIDFFSQKILFIFLFYLFPLRLVPGKKVMQFGIFVFPEVQEINLRGNLQGSKCDGDCTFL